MKGWLVIVVVFPLLLSSEASLPTSCEVASHYLFLFLFFAKGWSRRGVFRAVEVKLSSRTRAGRYVMLSCFHASGGVGWGVNRLLSPKYMFGVENSRV